MATACRFFFAVFSLFRFSLNLGILERPLAVGLLWGVVTGEYETAISVGIFFELFWLDQIPAGTYIPPHSLCSTFLALSLMDSFKMTQPGEIVYPILLSLPMGLVGGKLEYLQRRWQDGSYNNLLHWARMPVRRRNPDHPKRLVRLSLLLQLAVHFAFFTVSVLALAGVLAFLGMYEEPFALTADLRWPHLWFLAALGALLALRVKRSYVIVACSVLILAVFNTL